MISERATLLYAAKKEGIIKSNAHFWREYSSADKLKNILLDLEKICAGNPKFRRQFDLRV